MGSLEACSFQRLRPAAVAAEPWAVCHHDSVEVHQCRWEDDDAAEQRLLRRELLYILATQAISSASARHVAAECSVECQPCLSAGRSRDQQKYSLWISLWAQLLGS